MSLTARVLGLTVAGVLVIVLYVLPGVVGAYMHHASPLNFAIYLGDFMAFAMLALIVKISFGRGG
jgi:hypothetical protein